MTHELTRFAEAAEHYKLRRSDILEAGRSEWGVDPHEWECFSRMSPIEADLWACIRQVDSVFYPQYPIGWYFADFCNPVAGVVIECDGAAWHKDVEKDKKRQAAIERDGYTVYRITGKQCQDNQFALEFVRQISVRHRLIRGEMDCCVAYDHENRRYVVASREDLKNVNAGNAMDKKPGLAMVRDGLYVQDAWRIAKAFNGSTEKEAGQSD